MNFRRLIKTAIKWAPVVYPIVRKMLANKEKTKAPIRRR
ncbi:hypothetical protein MHZ92_16535 [Sporosarcina sp. ACRSL]|nr:hypothetical protein [Sporosarcina sp. ACRSL]MCG7345723.1 hypothetical protein [Sporosarcina sp. ACRSL]